jgi:hypothetical protein
MVEGLIVLKVVTTGTLRADNWDEKMAMEWEPLSAPVFGHKKKQPTTENTESTSHRFRTGSGQQTDITRSYKWCLDGRDKEGANWAPRMTASRL